MTPYEITELRLNISDKLTQSFRWWISITFAALVAAYVVGPDLAGATGAIIIGLYIVATFNNLVLQSSYLRAGGALEEEAVAYQEQAASPSLTLENMISSGSRSASIIRAQLILRGVMFVATIGYIIHRAGYIG